MGVRYVAFACLFVLVAVPQVSSAQGDETPAETPAVSPAAPEEPATEEQPSPAPELYVVSSGDEPDSLAEVQEIYREGDKPFVAFFWFWLVLIGGLAGVGGLAWFLWGRRGPPRISGR